MTQKKQIIKAKIDWGWKIISIRAIKIEYNRERSTKIIRGLKIIRPIRIKKN